MKYDFRELKADEIDIRVGAVTQKGYTLLLYKNARVDMTILDETIGQGFWQREHKEVKGNLYCGIGIWNNEIQQWVWKYDCGIESRMDADGNEKKGESSDAFKRAGFNWGIGRELYTAPFIWVNYECPDKKLPYEEQKRVGGMKVSKIEYADAKISNIEIVDAKGNVVFTTYKNQAKQTIKDDVSICGKEIQDDDEAYELLEKRLPNNIYEEINNVNLNVVGWAKYKNKRVCDLTLKDIKNAILDKKIAIAKKNQGNN